MASKGMVAGTAESARQEQGLGGRENMIGMVHVFKPQSPQLVMHLLQKGRAFSCFQSSSTNERPGIQMYEPIEATIVQTTTLNTLVYFFLHRCLLPLKGSLLSSNLMLHLSSHSYK